MLPAILVIFGVEYFFFMLFGGDVALPLSLTVAVLPTHPTMEVYLEVTNATGINFAGGELKVQI